MCVTSKTTMEYIILVFTCLVTFCQVESSCGSCGPTTVVSSPQLLTNGPYCAPQVVTSPVVATTVVDNSVSNALANALQLLIVSDLIESRLSKIAPSALLNTFSPILERLGPLCSPVVDVVAPCPTPIEVIPPCVPLIETITPTCYGSITETITPNLFCGYSDNFCSNPYVTETFIPNCYNDRTCYTETIAATPCGITEIITPNIGYNTNIATLNPNIYGGVTEVISTTPCAPCAPCVQQYPLNNVFSGFTEVVTPTCGPNFYSGVTEVFTQNPFANNYCDRFTEVITPVSSFNPGCCGGVTEIINSNPYTPNCYGGVTEIVSPFNPGCYNGITEVLTPTSYIPNYYGGVTEVITPFNSFNPGCFGGVTEVVTPNQFSPFFGGISEFISSVGPFNSGCMPEVITTNSYCPNYFGNVKEIIAPSGPYAPVAAEVLIPPAIPAQLTCNFGYMPTTVPCVSFNVEPLPFEPCGCGCNYPKAFYY